MLNAILRTAKMFKAVALRNLADGIDASMRKDEICQKHFGQKWYEFCRPRAALAGCTS